MPLCAAGFVIYLTSYTDLSEQRGGKPNLVARRLVTRKKMSATRNVFEQCEIPAADYRNAVVPELFEVGTFV